MLWKGKKALYHAIEVFPISSFYAVAQLTVASGWTSKGKRFGGGKNTSRWHITFFL